MSRKTLKLRQIVQDHSITEEMDKAFLDLLQKGLLLQLREGGFLTERQLRIAEERLEEADRAVWKGVCG